MKPRYLVIKEEIDKMIERKELKIGEQLPSEPLMAKKFKVSRETFRSAIKLLEKEGKLLVKHGVGTFVVQPIPEIPSNLAQLSSVTNMIKNAGLREGERREFLRIEAANEEWARLLNIQAGDPVILHERIRTANNEPVVLSKNILPYQLIGDRIFSHERLGSLFYFLETELNIRITRADCELVVPLHTDRNAQQLLEKPETTVLLLKQLHYDELNRPVLYSFDYFRNDIFKFWLRRSREDG